MLMICFGLLLFLKSPFSLSSLSQNFSGTHTFYSAKEIEDDNINVVINGNGFLINCSTEYAKSFSKRLNQKFVKGESFSFVGEDNDVCKLLKMLDGVVKKVECFDDIKVFYVYAPKISQFIDVDGQKINVQIAKNKGVITVGTPLILGSF